MNTFLVMMNVSTIDRIAYYVMRYKGGIAMKIEMKEQLSPDWTLEETFWAFDNPIDNCIPITVYQYSYQSVDGHGITQYGHQDINFWFFAYDTDKLKICRISVSDHNDSHK